MFFISCGLAVHVCVVVCLQKTDNPIITRHPLGFQMCVRLCSAFDGCYFPKYDLVQLRCILEITTVKNRSCGDVHPITKTCTIRTRYSRTIHTRRKGLRKVTRTWNKKAGTQEPPCLGELDTADRHTTLHQACKDGNLCDVQFILFQHPDDINIRNKLGRTPVMTTAWEGQAAVYHYLVGKGCDLSVKDDNNYTILHVASAGGSTDIVNDLVVNQKCDVEVKGKHGWTPVMVSVMYGSKDVLDLLVGKGCNVTNVDESMNNILHFACRGGHVDMVKYILSKKIYTIESKGEVGRTAVMIATYYGRDEVVQLLISYGCKLSVVDGRGDNILHVACLGGHVSMLKYILTLNISNIESRGQFGDTPAIRAARDGRIAVLDFLVKNGCNLTAVNDYMDTILHAACSNRYIDMVKHIVLKYKFDINSRGEDGRTPVMYAVIVGDTHVVKYLLGKGSRVSVVDSYGNNILHLACLRGRVGVVKYIVSHRIVGINSIGALGRTPVLVASYSGNVALIKYLVREGSNYTLADFRDNNILHLACFQDNVNVVRYILLILKINIESRDHSGWTPVMTAAYRGKRKVFYFLESQGSKLSQVSFDKNSILHLACWGGNTDLVKYLLTLRHAKRMKLSRNKSGKTPLNIAEEKHHVAIVSLLKDRM